jgi:hypothetical protein
VAKYPKYKTKYKSLGLKDKVLAKYYSTGGAKVNNLVKKAAINAAPGIGIVGKIVPKATRVVKELASKFTQAKKTLPKAQDLPKKSTQGPLSKAKISESLKRKPGENPAFGVRKRIVEKSLPPGSVAKKEFTNKFNKTFDNIANNPANYHSGASKLVRKTTNPILKEAIKESRNPSTAQITITSMKKAARNASNARVNQKLDAAQRLQNAAYKEAIEKTYSYRPKFEKPTQEMINKAGPVKIKKFRNK